MSAEGIRPRPARYQTPRLTWHWSRRPTAQVFVTCQDLFTVDRCSPLAFGLLTRIIHTPLLPRSSPPKKRRHVCDQAPDERFSSWDRSGVTHFPVSALCQGLFRTASRRTSILVRHHHHGSNEVEPTGALAIKASGTVLCRRDSPAPGHRALSRERNSESEI